jgi:hypothetical protein
MTACETSSGPTINNGMKVKEVEKLLGKSCDERMVPFKDNSGKKDGVANLVIYADFEKENLIPDSNLSPCQRFRLHVKANKEDSGVDKSKLPPHPKILRAVYYKSGVVKRHQKLRY